MNEKESISKQQRISRKIKSGGKHVFNFFFKSTKDYQFQYPMNFLSTERGYEKLMREIEELEKTDAFYTYESFEELVEQSNQERSLMEAKYKNVIGRIRIYFSLATIFTSVIILGAISTNVLTSKIQDHIESGCLNRIVTFVSLTILTHLLIRSIYLMGLALANHDSRLANNHPEILLGAFDLEEKEYKCNDAYRKIQQYITAKAISYSTKAIIRANNYVRVLVGESVTKLTRAIILTVIFSFYLTTFDAGIWLQIGYQILLLLIIIQTFREDFRNTFSLIKVIVFSPDRDDKEEMS